MTVPEIAAVITPLGLAKFRAGQLAEWMYRHHAQDFSVMTTIAKADRALLDKNFSLFTAVEKVSQHSGDGKTSKFLLAFADDTAVETVLMRQPYGNSVCVSSQAGCAMGCVFCASTLYGVARNLTAGEILAQVCYIQQQLTPVQQTINNIVIMGSGEPLANYENVLNFIRLCHADYCLNISYRSITLSTAGLVPQIKRLAAENLPITLSVSLHASNNHIRSALMPINDQYSLPEVIQAGGDYATMTGRRITYEYILIAQVNDQPEHAKELAKLLSGQSANVNLIPVNAVPERGLLRPSDKRIRQFQSILTQHHINATLRREMGGDIQAACGQLRNKTLPKVKSYVKIVPDLD